MTIGELITGAWACGMLLWNCVRNYRGEGPMNRFRIRILLIGAVLDAALLLAGAVTRIQWVVILFYTVLVVNAALAVWFRLKAPQKT